MFLDIPSCLPLGALHWNFLLPFPRWLHDQLLHYSPVSAYHRLLRETNADILFSVAHFPHTTFTHSPSFPCSISSFFHSNYYIQRFYIMYLFIVFTLISPALLKHNLTGQGSWCALFIDISQAQKIEP